jgi:hypothetical protein
MFKRLLGKYLDVTETRDLREILLISGAGQSPISH